MTVRRVKTYTAQTGYVYEYYFVGSRAALDGDPFAPSTEFIFDVSSDRKISVCRERVSPAARARVFCRRTWTYTQRS